MGLLLFCNNFQTTLASGINDSATSATLVSVAGLPTIVGDQYFKLSFIDTATQELTEIVNVTAVAGTVITMERGAEGTTPRAWGPGDIAAQQWTAGSCEALVQQFQMQAQAGNYAVAGGTGNAITAAFDPTFSAHIVGAPLRVKITAANTAATTFNPNGIGAVAVVAPDGTNLIGGDLVVDDVVEFIYNGASYYVQVVQASTTRKGITRLATVAEAEAGTSQTIAVTPAGLAATLALLTFVTPGSCFDWPASTPPAGYLERDGAAISRTTYSALNDLAAAVGYAAPWGAGDGSTTFNIPDDRGYFVRGWDDGAGVDPGRVFGTTQADAFASHNHQLSFADTNSASSMPGHGGPNPNTLHENTASTGGSETRPKNRAYLPIIKY